MKLSRDHLLMVAAVAFPLAGVVGGRFLPSRTGPSAAAASTPILTRAASPEDDNTGVDFQIPSADDPGKSAVGKIYRLAHQNQFGRNPLEKAPKFKPATVQAGKPEPAKNPNERLNEAMATFKSFELTSILNGRETLAVIGNRPRKVGDVLKSGWKLINIDTVGSAVVLQHEVAGTQVLKIRTHVPKGQEGTSGLEVVRPK